MKLTTDDNEFDSELTQGQVQNEYPEGLVIQPGGGEAVWLLDELLVFKIGGVETGDSIGFIEATARSGGGPPLHSHHMQAEAFYVLEGELTVKVGAQTRKVSSGSFVLVPPGVGHAYRVESKEPAKLLAMYTPPRVLDYFREIGEAAPVKTLPPEELIPDLERYVERGIRYSTEIIGPPI